MIQTRRLLLRRAQPSDLEPLHAIFSDQRAMRYWDRPAYSDIARTQAFLDGMINEDRSKSDEFIIERDGVCIGKAGVWARPDVGYILHPDHWGQGLATEAVGAVVERAFAVWPDEAFLTAEVDPRNASSARVLEKIGFKQVAYEEKNFLYGADEWCDTAYYRLDRPQT